MYIFTEAVEERGHEGDDEDRDQLGRHSRHQARLLPLLRHLGPRQDGRHAAPAGGQAELPAQEPRVHVTSSLSPVTLVSVIGVDVTALCSALGPG